MDYSYFQNDSGKFTAKRLPAPKNSKVKFKDESDLYDLKDEIREIKPSTAADFKQIHDHLFDTEYCYDVTVESFEDAMLANRQKLLGEDAWVKKYWHDLHVLIGDFDVGELNLEIDPQVIDTAFAQSLIKEGLVERVTTLDYEHWASALKNEKLPEIKERCKSLGIKITKKNKDALIHELIKFEEEQPNSLEQPVLVKPLPLLESKVTGLYELYKNEIAAALSSFEYPEPFKIAVWDYAIDEASGELKAILKDEIAKYEKTKPKKPARKQSEHIVSMVLPQYVEESDIHSLDNSIKIAFDYSDANDQVTFREFRLDKLKTEGLEQYIQGWCYLRNASRTFKFSRVMGSVTIIETGELLSLAEFNSSYLDSYFKISANEHTWPKNSQKGRTKKLHNEQQATGCLFVCLVMTTALIGIPIGLYNVLI